MSPSSLIVLVSLLVLDRGMLVLLGRRELGLAILGRAETSETWQLLTLLSLPSNI